MIETAAALAITTFARALTGVRANWFGCRPDDGRQRIYFANHASHGDFILVWAVLPFGLRRATRPVAGADYWRASPLRRFIGESVFDAVLIERDQESRAGRHPVDQICDALDGGSSLIFFPEGTRNTTDERLLPLKSGLYHLATQRPRIELVPVWIENLNRVMPKGQLVPVPLLCTVTFGAPIAAREAEDKEAFLVRARDALLALAPSREDRV